MRRGGSSPIPILIRGANFGSPATLNGTGRTLLQSLTYGPSGMEYVVPPASIVQRF